MQPGAEESIKLLKTPKLKQADTSSRSISKKKNSPPSASKSPFTSKSGDKSTTKTVKKTEKVTTEPKNLIRTMFMKQFEKANAANSSKGMNGMDTSITATHGSVKIPKIFSMKPATDKGNVSFTSSICKGLSKLHLPMNSKHADDIVDLTQGHSQIECGMNNMQHRSQFMDDVSNSSLTDDLDDRTILKTIPMEESIVEAANGVPDLVNSRFSTPNFNKSNNGYCTLYSQEHFDETRPIDNSSFCSNGTPNKAIDCTDMNLSNSIGEVYLKFQFSIDCIRFGNVGTIFHSNF